WEGLRGLASKAEGALAKSGLHDALVQRLGTSKPQLIKVLGQDAPHGIAKGELAKRGGGDFTPREARDFAAAHERKFGQSLTPITRVPVNNLEAMPHPPGLDDVQSMEFKTVDNAMRDAQHRHDGTRNV